jgi:hypothetical protein
MNEAERIIALDEALDEMILSRRERLVEFANTEEEKHGLRNSAIGAGAIGAGYAGSVAYRARPGAGGSNPFPRQNVGQRMKTVASGDMSAVKGGAQQGYQATKDAAGTVNAARKRGANRFKATRRAGGSRMRGAGNFIKPGFGRKLAKKLKFSNELLDDMLMFQSYSDIAEKQAGDRVHAERAKKARARKGVRGAPKARAVRHARKYGKRYGLAGAGVGLLGAGYAAGRVGGRNRN